MKRQSLALILTAVMSLITQPMIVMGQSGGVNTDNPDVAHLVIRAEAERRRESEEQARRKECADHKNKYNESRSKVRGLCGTSADCRQWIERCNKLNQNEGISEDDVFAQILNQGSVALGAQGFRNLGEAKGRCMSRSQYNSEVNPLKSDFDRVSEDITKLQRDIISDQNKAQQRLNELQKDGQQAKKDARKEDLEAKATERREAEDTQANLAKARMTMAELNSKILQGQAALADAIGKRTSTLAKLSDAMIQTNCMAAIEKVRNENNKAIRAGSAASVIRTNSERRRRLSQQYNMCVQEGVIAREAGREASDLQIQSMKMDIEAKRTQLRDLENQIQLAVTNQGQASQERQQEIQNRSQDRQNALLLLQQQIQSEMQNAQQKTSINMQRLNDLNQKKNRLSNELAALGEKPGREKSFEDAEAEAARADGLLAEWRAMCPNDPPPTDRWLPESDEDIDTAR